MRAMESAAVQSGTESAYEFHDNLGQQLQDWLNGGGKANGSFNGEYFDLGSTPSVFIKHGASEVKVIMLPDCVVKITGGKHSIALEEIAKLPIELNDPVLLFEGSVPNSFVAVTEMVDKQGNDVIVAVHINRRQKRLVVNRIASLYSKSDRYGNNHIESYVQQQIEAGNLLDASAKKAPIWFTNRGLQLPKLVQTIIDANTIKAQNSFGVNSYDMQNGGENSQIGNVELRRAGAKSTIAHGFGNVKLASARAIKDVIETGNIISKVDNYDGTSVTRYVIAARGQIGNEPACMGVIVKSYPDKTSNSKFYLHEATIIETGSYTMTAPQLSVDTVNEPVFNTNILQDTPGVNNYDMQNGGGSSQFSFGRVNGKNIDVEPRGCRMVLPYGESGRRVCAGKTGYFRSCICRRHISSHDSAISYRRYITRSARNGYH